VHRGGGIVKKFRASSRDGNYYLRKRKGNNWKKRGGGESIGEEGDSWGNSRKDIETGKWPDFPR